MALNINRGIVASLMKDFQKAAGTGGRISAPEARKVADKAVRMLSEAYEGADSSAGLAKDVKAIATTFRAADKNWKMTGKSYEIQREVFGAKLDGKAGELGALTKQIRNSARTSSVPTYSGS